ncbi:MAG TPA: protein-L-isoaspartate(D-aspartate) O-methyltransferase [Candidatus Didemnitutus sp.]|nr:protein-L-isoaspartate(D-aspartate) O-methyltransferase [Candidatus Didemnitutus sp.]
MSQLPLHNVTDPAVVRAMRVVPREEFVPFDNRAEAHADRALPIGYGQTISQPAVVAYMLARLRLRPTDRVLEIGTGSGYQAAILAELAGEVFTIERIAALAAAAHGTLARLGYGRVHVRCADGADGWPEAAPFDAIMVAAATPRIPEAWRAQLQPAGRLIVPVGPAKGDQRLELWRRDANGVWRCVPLWDVRFVPLVAGRA